MVEVCFCVVKVENGFIIKVVGKGDEDKKCRLARNVSELGRTIDFWLCRAEEKSKK